MDQRADKGFILCSLHSLHNRSDGKVSRQIHNMLHENRLALTLSEDLLLQETAVQLDFINADSRQQVQGRIAASKIVQRDLKSQIF